MFREGHLGVTLALSVPIVGVLAAAGHWELAGFVFVIVFASEPLPDLDSKPYVSLPHRGPFHSIVFAVGIGLLASTVGFGYGTTFETLSPAVGAALGGFSGLYGVCTHLFADTLNPMGVGLFWPVSDRIYHIPEPNGLCEADNPIANSLFLFGGILLALIASLAVALVRLF